jgi:acyl-homoserine-lactone acylase
MPGGFERSGNFTVIQTNTAPVLKPDVGYGPMNEGNSYIQVVALTPAGVDASTLVTYSLSTDTASPRYDDYSRRYSTKQWVKAAFTEAEIAADTTESVELSQ